METGTVYADVLALINFSMDFVTLRITSSILRKKPRLWRSVLGAAIGAVYSIFALLSGIDGLWQIPLDAASALLICFVAFGAKKAYVWLLSSSVFFTVGFILGGVMTAVYSRAGEYSRYLEEGGNISLAEGAVDGKTFILICVISTAVTAASGKIISAVRKRKNIVLHILCAGSSAKLELICDSGNMAREPISGLQVIFLSERAASFLPPGIIEYMKTGNSGECADKTLFRIVPLKTVDGEGMKYAVRCDRVTGECGEEYGAVLAISSSVPQGADGIAPAELSEIRTVPTGPAKRNGEQ